MLSGCVVARDFLTTVLDALTPPVFPLTESSPVSASASAKKRTRSALRSLTLNDGTGSPEKREKLPPRKISRASTTGSDKSDKENMMVE